MKSVRQQYRITSWRFDVPKQTHSTPVFEGESIEECDEKARQHFQSISDRKENSWDGMDIVRIDSPAIAEKTTYLMSNGRQMSNDDHSL